MNNTLQHNLTVIREGVKKQLPNIEQRFIMSIFTLTAAAVFEWIDSHEGFYLDQTFNLRDSIGVGVFKNGVLVNWIQTPSPKATSGKYFGERSDEYAGGNNPYSTYISGRELLNTAITEGKYSNFADYALVVYATAPYGIVVEDGNGKRGTGWWSEGLIPHVKERFITTIAKYNAK